MLSKVYDSVVVGAGGAGIATVGALLHSRPGMRIAWIDPNFRGGRMSQKYRDVSSNTKTALFRQYADAFEPFRQVIASTPTPNAMSALDQLDQGRGCRLEYAADMLEMLTTGLLKFPNIDAHVGKVDHGHFRSSSAVWSSQLGPLGQSIQSRSIVMCTGSAPSSISIPPPSPANLDLDIVLHRQKLREALPSTKRDLVVGVVGTSHSAIVAVMNLYELAKTTHPQLQVRWFARSPLMYAEEMDGWILRDNTGLKGASADFAREHLEDDKLPHSPVGKFLTRVQCPDIRDPSMKSQRSTCTHILQAVGYHRNPLPSLLVDGSEVKGITYDPERGSLVDQGGNQIPHAFGAGIAFPERVTDPAGNTEHAVGLWKFIKYLKRVAPTWQ